MEIEFDPAKRAATLAQRGLDFMDARHVFAGAAFEFEDRRFDYPEPRWSTIGMLGERMVVVIWTETPSGRRIISMRKANEREQARYGGRLA